LPNSACFPWPLACSDASQSQATLSEDYGFLVWKKYPIV
jgi:hypothetical protein